MIRRHPIVATAVGIPLVLTLTLATLVSLWLAGVQIPGASAARWFTITKTANADYTPTPGLAGVNPRTDYFFKGSIGLLYEVNPHYSIGPLYEFSSGTTTDVAAGGPQYTRNFFSIRLVARR